jgi:nicotinamidase-related amidase
MGALLEYGPLTKRTVHLCVDMQEVYARDTPWHTPWMSRVLPIVCNIARHHSEQTIFTRFMPPIRPEDMHGTWRRFYERWRDMTRDRIAPELLELVAPLRALAPPATIVDKMLYSAFSTPALLPRLQRHGIDSLVITGAETDMCVLATVLDAVDLGYRVVLVTDALCSSSDTTHDALMTLYRQRYSQQIETSDSETVLTCWTA